jgi:hypothetical protein
MYLKLYEKKDEIGTFFTKSQNLNKLELNFKTENCETGIFGRLPSNITAII